MQESKVLYTANEGQRVLRSVHIPRWVDALTFVGVVLAIGVVLGSAASSGDPTALMFVQTALWVMGVTMGVFVLLLLINWMGWWGLLALAPLAMLAVFWVAGMSGNALMSHWAQEVSNGVWQGVAYGLYGFAGLAGLGLLARVMEKVGVAGFLMTLAVAAGISFWLIGRL